MSIDAGIVTSLAAQRIELPSWAFGNSGTRFKVFAQAGVPRTPHEKIADAAQVHKFTGVAPTEMFHSMGQKFVGIEGQKYKPLSNSDVTFIEKGLPTISKDPRSIPHLLGAMKTVAQRDQMAKSLEMEFLKSGKPPDLNLIKAMVDRAVPSYVEKMYRDNGADLPKPTSQAPVRVNSPEEARKLPKGTPIILPDGTPGQVP